MSDKIVIEDDQNGGFCKSLWQLREQCNSPREITAYSLTSIDNMFLVYAPEIPSI